MLHSTLFDDNGTFAQEADYDRASPYPYSYGYGSHPFTSHTGVETSDDGILQNVRIHYFTITIHSSKTDDREQQQSSTLIKHAAFHVLPTDKSTLQLSSNIIQLSDTMNFFPHSPQRPSCVETTGHQQDKEGRDGGVVHKTARFNEEVNEIYDTIHRDDLTEEERASMWLTGEDWDRIRNDFYNAKNQQCPSVKRYQPPATLDRKATIRYVQLAVLREQAKLEHERQKMEAGRELLDGKRRSFLEDCQRRHLYSGENYPHTKGHSSIHHQPYCCVSCGQDRLAAVYHSATKKSRDEAYHAGLLVEAELIGYGNKIPTHFQVHRSQFQQQRQFREQKQHQEQESPRLRRAKRDKQQKTTHSQHHHYHGYLQPQPLQAQELKQQLQHQTISKRSDRLARQRKTVVAATA